MKYGFLKVILVKLIIFLVIELYVFIVYDKNQLEYNTIMKQNILKKNTSSFFTSGNIPFLMTVSTVGNRESTSINLTINFKNCLAILRLF